MDKAKAELDESTSIRFEYEPIRVGTGGKTNSIRFLIYDKKTTKVEEVEKKTIKILTPEEKEDFIDQVNEVIEEKLKVKDLRAIAEAAEYDISKVEKAYKVLLSSGKIDNITGFMIKAIQDGYEEPVMRQKKTEFNNFKQNIYDFTELEEQLLDN